MVLPAIGPESMECVREIVRVLLRMWRKSELEFVTELGVTELLTNVLKHTPGDCELLVRETPDGILVGVTDFENALPTVKDPGKDAEGGRGLFPAVLPGRRAAESAPAVREAALVPDRSCRRHGGRSMTTVGAKAPIEPTSLLRTTVRVPLCFGDTLPRDLESGSFARFRPPAARTAHGRAP